ncbi:MAG: alpha/beta hydrolase [Desulfobacterales bacterium]|nr:alpha/beta hydrolase [Desulfobacterales bacterium]
MTLYNPPMDNETQPENEINNKEVFPIEVLISKYFNAHSKFITIENMNIHYRDEGSGPILVLLHGVCSSLHTWDAWVKHLKPYYRVIRIDIPGFGFSGPFKKEIYDPDKGVQLIHQIISALNIENFYLAGNSIGGFFSWRYTLKYPEKVDKLILIDPVGYNQALPWVVKFASHPAIRPLAKFIMPRFFFHMAANQVYGDKSKLTKDIKARYFDLAMYKDNKKAYVNFFTVMRNLCDSPDLPKGITEIKTPTMVMWGTKDEWVPLKYCKQWKNDLQNGTFVIYEGAGHTPNEEIPEKTAQDACLFLEGKFLSDKIIPDFIENKIRSNFKIHTKTPLAVATA